MAAQIELPPVSLMAMLHAAYKCSDNALDCLENLLHPYYISFEQLQCVAGTLRWNYTRRAVAMHPMTHIVKHVEVISKLAHYKAAENKKRFLYIATSIAHLWYHSRRIDGTYVLQTIPHCFTPYECANSPIPFVWFNVNEFNGLDVQQRSHGMVPLEVVVERSCAIGAMMSLKYEFEFDHPQKCEKAVIVIDNSQYIVLCTRKLHMPNFMVLLSKGPAMVFINCFCASPSLGRVWLYPVLMHPLEVV